MQIKVLKEESGTKFIDCIKRRKSVRYGKIYIEKTVLMQIKPSKPSTSIRIRVRNR